MASRRRFLAGVLTAWLPSWRVEGRHAEAADPSLAALLDAVVDTIVPRDATAGALDVGVPQRIRVRLADAAEAERLYGDGLALLEATARSVAGAPFRSLDLVSRERLLLALDGAGEDALGRRFLRRVREDVLSLYWASVQAQQSVGYRVPAGGYPEYADPPPQPRAPRR